MGLMVGSQTGLGANGQQQQQGGGMPTSANNFNDYFVQEQDEDVVVDEEEELGHAETYADYMPSKRKWEKRWRVGMMLRKYNDSKG